MTWWLYCLVLQSLKSDEKKHNHFIGVDTLHSPIITTPEEPYLKGVTVFSLGLRNHLVYNKNTKQIFRYRNPNIFTFTTLIKKPLYLFHSLVFLIIFLFFCKMARLINLHYVVQNDQYRFFLSDNYILSGRFFQPQQYRANVAASSAAEAV